MNTAECGISDVGCRMSNADSRASVLVAGVLRSAWRKPERLSVSRWAAKNRRICDNGAAEPGDWSNERVPFLAAPMDAYSDSKIRKVVVKKAEQVGGTEVLFNFLLSLVDQDPGPALWLWPTKELAGDVCRERLIPTFRGCAAIANRFTDRKQDVQTLKMAFDRMTLRLAGSNSESGYESFPYRFVLVDELDRCPRHIVDAVIGRTTTFEGREKIGLNGRPDLEGYGIDAEYAASDQREYMVPCPRCGVYHIRTWQQVKWEGGLEADESVVAETAWFRCPACDGSIHGYENAWQLARGVWCPKGMAVTECDIKTGTPGTLVGTPERVAGGQVAAGFWIRGLLNPFKRNVYGFVAAEFVKNKGQATREWVTRRLGEAWKEAGYKVEAHELSRLCIAIEDSSGEGYKRGVAPFISPDRCVLGITAGCDVQKDRIFVEVLGWGRQGEETWLIEHRELPRQVGDGLEHLWPFLLQKWPVVDLKGGRIIREMGITAAGVDSGAFTREVYNQTRMRQWGRWPNGIRGPQVWATKGHFASEHAKANESTYTWSWPEHKAPPGVKTIGSGGVKTGAGLLVMALHTFKTEVYHQLRNSMRAMAQAEKFKAGLALKDGEFAAVKKWHFAEDTSPAYFAQLAAEQMNRKMVAGHMVDSWSLRPGVTDNHYLDCRVINLAIAAARGVRMLGADADARPAASGAQQAARTAGAAGGRVERRAGGWWSGMRRK